MCTIAAATDAEKPNDAALRADHARMQQTASVRRRTQAYDTAPLLVSQLAASAENCSCISDPQGSGKCPQVPGAPTGRPTGKWEVPTGAGSTGGPAYRPPWP